MVINYPQQLAAAREVTGTDAQGVFVRMFGRLGQLLCGLHGHDAVLAFEENRVLLRCTSCGHNSPGWNLEGENRPTLRFHGDAERHLIARPIMARRSA
jgi:hypothetical protein